ncbi:MAG: hypothetical protein JO163_18205 [Methylobacteriaceae bacterium]|nr:hypothetical protein [Methylobacteriaceae bacterium]MBV9635281.1 hypothetical protein [Methylobacteriaceae bacterium]MBV9704666.1 hypothetical protein [Methylobacteriaceae bacterium]
MHKILAWTLAAGFAVASIVSTAQAMPAWAPLQGYGGPAITPVFGGCGPYMHRGPYGGCRPGGQWGGYWTGGVRPCPPGFHLGPYGRRCWPN